MMATQTKDLWRLVKYRPQVDPDDLAEAVEAQAGEEGLDYRTRLLIRDSVDALKGYWGESRFKDWLGRSPTRTQIEVICKEDFERPGFPSLRRRLMKKTDAEEIRSYLRELGAKVHRPLRINIAGSASVILPGYLVRNTDDIDIVDEVPAELRSQHAFLHDLESRYALKLAHVQRHYLPMGWEQRLHYEGAYGQLQVYLLDIADLFVGKLFSIRTRDRDDLRALKEHLDKAAVAQRLKDTSASMLASPELRQRAEQNWYILYGEPLPA
jgi:hypothetical protein